MVTIEKWHFLFYTICQNNNLKKKGLKAFKEEHPDCRLILVSLDPITRCSGDTKLIYILDFLKMLWNGEIF